MIVEDKVGLSVDIAVPVEVMFGPELEISGSDSA